MARHTSNTNNRNSGVCGWILHSLIFQYWRHCSMGLGSYSRDCFICWNSRWKRINVIHLEIHIPTIWSSTWSERREIHQFFKTLNISHTISSNHSRASKNNELRQLSFSHDVQSPQKRLWRLIQLAKQSRAQFFVKEEVYRPPRLQL